MVKVKDCTSFTQKRKEIICFNHPMVKVKAKQQFLLTLTSLSFNHPMVKVKADMLMVITQQRKGFNHPMVKVKVQTHSMSLNTQKFQPPYGES